jgi:uncharacterized protein (DUF1330 family)
MVQIPPAAEADAYLRATGAIVAQHGGSVLASVRADDVECLEAGTPPAAFLLARFDSEAALDNCWSDEAHRAALAPLEGVAGLLIIVTPGLPAEGLPEMLEIPTTASVTPPAGRGPPAYMVIQGSSTDQDRMDQYRDIILPMLKEQGAYYIAFEIEGGARVLHGDWPYDIFAISRWPDHAAGHTFWDSDRYQHTAIPLRTGAGEFWVHYFVGDQG